jgi:hypothetical protein
LLTQRQWQLSRLVRMLAFTSGHDLTKKWTNRIHAKIKDGAAAEAFSKVSALVDYYNKPPQQYKEDIDWKYWEDNIRTEGVVTK